MDKAEKVMLSEQEADLYDRQIRLWGLESQSRLRKADVLLINIRGLGSEIAKNIVLAGIKSLTVLDSGNVSQEDINANFFLSPDSLGKPLNTILAKIQLLNPMVQVKVDSDDCSAKDETFFKSFTLIIATKLPSSQLVRLDQFCRANGVYFMCGDVFGMFGYMFADLEVYEYYDQVTNFKLMSDNGRARYTTVTTQVKRTSTFVPFQDAFGSFGTKQEHSKIASLSQEYFLFRTLLSFRDVHKRDLFFQEKNRDLQLLRERRNELFENWGLNEAKLPDRSFEHVFGEVPAVCSVLGGIIAQDIIKAISHKEVPINNMFFFNPDSYSGAVELVEF